MPSGTAEAKKNTINYSSSATADLADEKKKKKKSRGDVWLVTKRKDKAHQYERDPAEDGLGKGTSRRLLRRRPGPTTLMSKTATASVAGGRRVSKRGLMGGRGAGRAKFPGAVWVSW